MEVVAVPRTGGPARRFCTSPTPARSATHVAASPQRVAVIAEIDDEARDEHRVYSGPPSGPLRLVLRTPDRSDGWTPLRGQRRWRPMLLSRASPRRPRRRQRHQVRARILDAPGGRRCHGRASKRGPWRSPGLAAVVADDRRASRWSTSRPARRCHVDRRSTGIGGHRPAADGRVAVAARAGSRSRARPAGAQRPEVRPSGRPRASRAARSSRSTRPPTVRRRDDPSAARTASLVRTDADADQQRRRVAVNGCVRYAPLAGRGPGGRDPCPARDRASR